MLPLATILIEQGATVAGSDRALDQGRLGEKFGWLQARGMTLFPQDGSGLHSGNQILVASAAVEDSVPDIARGKELGCRRVTRAELLADLFNASTRSVAVGGTSGKSTVTGMIGWVASEAGLDPTIMNGAVMRNFAREDSPFASSRVGHSGLFVSEVDESDGSIALFHPEIAVLNNITLDHKSLEELRHLFGAFARGARHAIWNADDAESAELMKTLIPSAPSAEEMESRIELASPPCSAPPLDANGKFISFGFAAGADFRAVNVLEAPLSVSFTLCVKGRGLSPNGDSPHSGTVPADTFPVTTFHVGLAVPGRHNVANALAALAAADVLGIPLDRAVAAIGRYMGLARRFEILGNANGITVIDDFGHNPDKISATLDTLKAFPGRVIAFFQPHGFGPLRVMGKELADVFAAKLDANDRLFLCDPVYFGGTTDKSIGSDFVIDRVNQADSVPALHIPDREACGRAMTDIARPGDRIVVMGARDDTLRQFASGLLEVLAKANPAG